MNIEKQKLYGSISGQIIKLRFLEKAKLYEASPNNCLNCGIKLSYKKRSNKFCSHICSAIVNNPKRTKVHNCITCGSILDTGRKFCNNRCQNINEYNDIIRLWKAGEISGLRPDGLVTPTIKKYLRIKFEDKCCLCGWCEINPFTNKVPLVADHIDGNWKNNKEENLRLICSNCDSLSSTYKGANRGKGRGILRYKRSRNSTG